MTFNFYWYERELNDGSEESEAEEKIVFEPEGSKMVEGKHLFYK